MLTPTNTEEALELVEARDAPGALYDDKAVRYLIAGCVAAPTRAVRLPNEADREASFSVYKTDNPASCNQPFLLIFRTVQIVTAHGNPPWSRVTLGRVPDGYSGFPAYSRMHLPHYCDKGQRIYLRTVHYCYSSAAAEWLAHF